MLPAGKNCDTINPIAGAQTKIFYSRRHTLNEGTMRRFVKALIYWEDAKAHFRSFPSAESGATAMEYALLAAGIGVAILAGVSFYADSVAEMFGTVSTTVTE